MDSSLPLDSAPPDTPDRKQDSSPVAAVVQPRASVLELIWRVVLFNWLLVAWYLPWSNWSAFIHEFGHLLAAILKGGKAYGFVVWTNHLGAGGMSLLDAGAETRSSYLLSIGGVGICVVAGLGLMLAVGRMGRSKALRFGLGFFAALMILRSFFYLLEGYYGEMGDFSTWKRNANVWGHAGMGVLYALSLPLGYAMGRWFLPIAEMYLPSASKGQRLAQMVCGIAPLYLYLTSCYLYTWGMNVVIPGVYLLAAGGMVLAAMRAPVGEPEERAPFSPHAYLIPVALLGLAYWLIRINGGYFALPTASEYPTPLEKYRDAKVVSLPNQTLMPQVRDFGNLDTLFLRTARIDIDGKGRFFGLTPYDRSLWQIEEKSGEFKTLYRPTGRTILLRLKYHDGQLFVLGARRRTMFIGRYDLKSGGFESIYEGILGTSSGLAVGRDGSVYFVDGKHRNLGGNTLCRLDPKTGQIVTIRSGLPAVYGLSIAPQEKIVCWSDEWQAGMIFTVSGDGKQTQMLDVGIRYLNDMVCDPQGNVYLAQRGNDSILKLSAPDYEPMRLRGPYYTTSLSAVSADEIYYYCWEKKQVRKISSSK